MKIAIVGTHGTGKSTLSYILASEFKKMGKNVKIVQEVARTCPFGINDGMSVESALWIYHEQARKEMEAEEKHEIVICDRSVFDSFIYAKYFKLQDWRIEGLRSIATTALCVDYGLVIFLEPDIPLQTDGTRSKDLEFQKGINELFKIYLPCDCKVFKSSQIFNPDTSWTSFCQLLLERLLSEHTSIAKVAL